MTLHNTTIVITGASSGIGKAAALALAAEGANVAVVGRTSLVATGSAPRL